jgi:hypothetical protein
MKRVLAILSLLVPAMAAQTPRTGPSVDFSHGDLRISDNRRFLVHKDGTPFFYLGDTAWELFHRLNREEVERYLENRRAKGFTVIQAVILAELDGLRTPNPYGETPLIGNDPCRPNEKYFEHVDWVIDKAAEKGLFIGLLPTWGDKVSDEHPGAGPQIFTPANAEAYGRWLGERYRNRPNVIWIVGGDWTADSPWSHAIWCALGRGLRQGDWRHLISFHPRGGRRSSEWFHNEPWLDFNMHQSGHVRYRANYEAIAADYALRPIKPTMDAEPRYETAPSSGYQGDRLIEAFDVRQAAYWGLFAGAHGTTYGAQGVWNMHAPGRPARGRATPYWYELLDLPGAWHMMHVRNLIESRPMLERVPDQSLIVSENLPGPDYSVATRGNSYAFIYSSFGKPLTVALGKISGDRVVAWWFDPRTGQATRIGEYPNAGVRTFTPPGTPGRDNDWILVLDDASKGYPPPGAIAKR